MCYLNARVLLSDVQRDYENTINQIVNKFMRAFLLDRVFTVILVFVACYMPLP